MSEKTLINFLEPDKRNTDVEKDRSLQANSDEMSNTLRQLSHQIVNVIRYHCYNKNEFHKIFQMIQNPETSRHSFIVANPYVNSRMGAFHRDDTNFVYSVFFLLSPLSRRSFMHCAQCSWLQVSGFQLQAHDHQDPPQ